MSTINEEDFKKMVDELFSPPSMRERMEKLAIILWAGLITDDPTLTREQVANMLCPGNAIDLAALAIKAWSGAFSGELPADDPEVDGKDPLDSAAAAQ